MVLDDVYLALGKAICFTQFSNSNVKLFQKHPTDTLRNIIQSDIWASNGLLET